MDQAMAPRFLSAVFLVLLVAAILASGCGGSTTSPTKSPVAARAAGEAPGSVKIRSPATNSVVRSPFKVEWAPARNMIVQAYQNGEAVVDLKDKPAPSGVEITLKNPGKTEIKIWAP